jgi:hypothetical protein
MPSLKDRVVYPDHFYYILYFVGSNPFLAVQQFYDRFPELDPDLAGHWVDLADFTADDLDEIDECLIALDLSYSLRMTAKNEPEYDDDVA